MRYIVERYGTTDNGRTYEWREAAATNDEPFARHLLLLLASTSRHAMRLIDADSDSGQPETIATIGAPPDA